jgi:hypothetical protein
MKLRTAARVSPCGSTVTASTVTSLRSDPRRLSASSMCTADSGQTSGQWVYMKVSITTFPRCAESRSSCPFWSRSAKSGVRAGCEMRGPTNGGVPAAAAAEHSSSAPTTMRIALLIRRPTVDRI